MDLFRQHGTKGANVCTGRCKPGARPIERIVNLHIEKLPKGLYLATSDDLPGLVAQGRTVSETIEIARDVARKLIEAGGAGGVGWVERQR